jgi:hypothetical protein
MILRYLFYAFLLSSAAFAKESYTLTNTGGVSLGVYEAGHLYHLINTTKNKDDSVNDLILSGASAGAINSFISILEGCAKDVRTPSQSLFWKSWLPLSLERFYIKKGEKSDGLLSRSSLDDVFATLEQSWNRGIKKGCRSYLGVTVTRKEPLSFIKNEGLDFPRHKEFFTLKITGRGSGKRPLVENFNLKDGSIQAFLPFKKEGNNFKLLKQLLLASSSFPVAFESTELKHCLIYNKQSTHCDDTNSRTDYFIDGGIYNNAPIDVAYKISKALKREGKDQFIILDPEIKNYPSATDEIAEIEKGMISETFDFFKNFVSSSRKGQVADFLGNHPELARKVMPIKGSLPLASEPLYGFFGFFEKDFRVFDFYVGMLDASQALKANQELKLVTKKEFMSAPQDMLFHYCMESVFLGNTEVLIECLKRSRKGKSSNLKSLLLVSVDRLFNRCYELDKELYIENKLCKMAANGFGPEKFTGIDSGDWKRRKEEAQVVYILRRLNYYGFHYKDLGLDIDEGHRAIFKVKEKIVKAAKYASKAQPKDDKFLLSQFTAPAVNFAFYTPSLYERTFYVGNNALELSFSNLINDDFLSKFFTKLNYGFMFNGIDTLLKQENIDTAFLPFVGLRFESLKTSSAVRQFNFGLRVGYQLASEVDYKLNECEKVGQKSDTFLKCSDTTVQFTVGMKFLETVDLQFVQQFMPFTFSSKEWPRYSSIFFGWQF